MDLLEFENQMFPGLWNEESIADLRKSAPPERENKDIVRGEYDEDADELYREFQEANWNEYFDPARTYRYCLWY